MDEKQIYSYIGILLILFSVLMLGIAVYLYSDTLKMHEQLKVKESRLQEVAITAQEQANYISLLQKELETKESKLKEVKTSLNLPITAEESIEIAKKNGTVKQFIETFSLHTKDHSSKPMIETASLIKMDNDYTWKVEIMSGACGCATPYYKVVNAYINPISGQIEGIKIIERTTMEEYSAESCMQSCH
jgi:hypothetical protein